VITSALVSGIAKDDPYAPLTDEDPNTEAVSELHKRSMTQAAYHSKQFLKELIDLIKEFEKDTSRR